MTGGTQYTYIPKHHPHLFTHTTFSVYCLVGGPGGGPCKLLQVDTS